MKWLENLKFQSKLILSFGTLVGLLIAVSVISSSQLFSVDTQYNELISTALARQESTSKGIDLMNRINNINLKKGLLFAIGTDTHEITELNMVYNEYVETYSLYKDVYLEALETDTFLNDAEKRERKEIGDAATDLFMNHYLPRSAELDAALYADNERSAYLIINELVIIGDQIIERLEDLHMKAVKTAEIATVDTNIRARQIIVMHSVLNMVLIVFSLVITVYMTRTVTNPINKIKDAMTEISNGNLAYQIRGDRKDELGSLANQIGDMVDNIAGMNKAVAVMDIIDSMVMVVDYDYNFIYVNQSLADTYGLDMNDYRDQKCHKAMRGLDRPCSICQFGDLKELGDTVTTQENKLIYDKTVDMWLSGTARIIKWVDGRSVFFQTVNNVTELKKIQDELSVAMETAEAASEVKSQFLANMSHEIRTPMNAVLGMAELLLQENLNNRQLRYVEDMKSSAMALLTIINDILDVSKIQAGKLSLLPVHYDFDMLIDNIGSITQFLVEGKNIAFRLVMQEHPPLCLYGDDGRVRQVLLNLLSNAVKFTNEGYVQLSIGFTDDKVLITVSDTGIGIPPENLTTLFDAFEQADVLRNRSTKGTGLGLTITRSMVEMMEGRLSVESVYGKGSSFYVELPLILGDEALIHRTEDDSGVVYAPDARILIVDDNKTNLNVASGLLRLCSITTDTATSGMMAISMVQQHDYDIVLMDYRMPEMNGIETTKAIRGLGLTLPIVALTASAVGETKMKMISSGMDDYLSKPLVKAELMSMLEKWLPPDKLLEIRYNTPRIVDIEDESHMEFWRRIYEIEEISISIGLERVDRQRDVYLKSLRLIIHELQKSEKNLIKFLSGGDLENFRIEVHGIKGALANIGAMDLSSEAYDLEMAAKKADLSFCIDNLPNYLDKLYHLSIRIEEAFKLIAPGYGPIDTTPEMTCIFESMIAAFGDMDLVRIDSELENLDALKLSGAAKDLVEQIKDAILMMDYDAATEHIGRMLDYV